jgi:CelD/BcsL family acetyltransferase involved in cellulose biosynthesis
LAADPNAVATQSPQWLDSLCRARGYRDSSRLYELPDGRTLILPLVSRTAAAVRITLDSWPYGWGYGGVLVSGGRFTAADARVVLADLSRQPVLRTTVVPTPHTAAEWEMAAPRYARRLPYLTQILDLDGGFDTVWSKRYRSQVRRCVRRAERAGLDIRMDHGGAVVETFAALYRESVDRWATQRGQPLPLARFLARCRDRAGQLAVVSNALGESCEIWSAHYRGEPVAVRVSLRFGEHSIGWLAASDSDLARETLANYLLSSNAIEHACHTGARYFNMGESDPGSGVERYKTYFGPRSVEYDALRFERLPITPAGLRLRSTVQGVADWRARRSGSAGPEAQPGGSAGLT